MPAPAPSLPPDQQCTFSGSLASCVPAAILKSRAYRLTRTLCPSGLRGWTQVPLARAAWVQIPQVSMQPIEITMPQMQTMPKPSARRKKSGDPPKSGRRGNLGSVQGEGAGSNGSDWLRRGSVRSLYGLRIFMMSLVHDNIHDPMRSAAAGRADFRHRDSNPGRSGEGRVS